MENHPACAVTNDRLFSLLGFVWLGGLFYLALGHIPPTPAAPLTLSLIAVARLGVFLVVPGCLLFGCLPRPEVFAPPAPGIRILLVALGGGFAAHLFIALLLPVGPESATLRPSLARVFLPQATAAFLVWIRLEASSRDRLLELSPARLKSESALAAVATALLIALLSLIVIVAFAFGYAPIAARELTSRPFALRRDLVELALAIICIPLCEEILFRVGLLGRLTRLARPRVAVVLSAAIFALLHMQMEIFWARFIGGIFMGWVYLGTGGLLAPWLLHAAMNAGLLLAPVLWNH